MTLSDKLRNRALRQAVESNLDEIHGRLPYRLRPSARTWRGATRWTPVAALVVSALVAANGSARSDAPSFTWASTPPSVDAVARSSRQSDGPPTLAWAAQPFAPRVLALAVRKVVIDAGHGGDNRGTTSADGIAEKFFTLDIARRLRIEMQARGFTTVMTRDDDHTVSLQRRAAIANSGGADVFVSIHINSFASTSTAGIETYYLGPSDSREMDDIAERENQHSGYSMADLRTLLDRIFTDARRDESKRLALAVQRSLVTGMRDAGASPVDRGVKKAPFVVLVATDMPAVLAEVSCLSNPDEAERLAKPDYRQHIAAALAMGVEHFARARG